MTKGQRRYDNQPRRDPNRGAERRMIPDPIEPALTAEEWADFARSSRLARTGMLEAVLGSGQLPKVLAMANAALPDGDPRKITPQDVLDLQSMSNTMDYEPVMYSGDIDRIAAKLAALLPPKP